MDIDLLVEPTFAASYWYPAYLEGITYETGRRGVGFYIPDLTRTCCREIMAERKDRPRSALVLGGSAAWLLDTAEELIGLGIHPVLVGNRPVRSDGSISYVAIDDVQSAAQMTSYLLAAGRRRIAFFGKNPDSISDACKYEGFASALKNEGIQTGESDVYYNRGALEETISSFYGRIDRYDAVFCANDYVAESLICSERMKNIAIPGRLFVTGFGESMMSRCCSPTLTTVTLDYFETGKSSVDLCLFLCKNGAARSCTVTVESRIRIGETTAFTRANDLRPRRDGGTIGLVNFCSDPLIRRATAFERLLEQSDSLDLSILRGLLAGETYEAMADRLNISENTVKYRIKRMLAKSEISTKGELLALCAGFLRRS